MSEAWFSQFGWNENPFKIQPDPEHVVGFVDLRARIMAYVESHDPFLIVGPTGAGKTTLLLWTATQTNARYVYHNFLDERSDASLRRKVRGGLLGFFDRRPIIALLDEVQEMAPETARYLRGIFDQHGIQSVVMAAMTDKLPNLEEPLLSRIGERKIYVRNVDERESMQIIRQRVFAKGKDNPFDEDALRIAFAYAEYSPRKILETCEKLCIDGASKGKTRIDADFASLVLKPKEPTLAAVKNAIVTPPSGEIKRLVREKLRKIMESDAGTEIRKTPPATPIVQTVKPATVVDALSPTQRKIYEALRAKDMTTDELARAVGITRASAAKQLSRLALNTDAELLTSRGITKPLVVQKGSGRPVVYGVNS
ncbi:MAG: AAA family ATPase [Candidatus Aenigmatarchaeota archaeon]|nr:MAG: AAA family ATPase [Candidatus Aenigmarchaeota archaeon]